MNFIVKDDRHEAATKRVLADFRKNNPTKEDRECAEHIARKVKEMYNERLRDRR